MKITEIFDRAYHRRPLLLIILIAIIATIPWCGMGGFYTKGEPREAALSTVMLTKGGNQWIIPQSYADEFAYKPPLNHWMIAGLSSVFTKGKVTPFTSRLPSAIAFIAMVGICFACFSKWRNQTESFIACLIIISCFELHRAAMTARIDMLLTFFLVAAIIQLFNWHRYRKKKQLICSWLLLSIATLDKGPIGIVLPCLVFFVYLIVFWIRQVSVDNIPNKNAKKDFWKDFLKLIILAILSFIIPLIWYYLAYQIQGTPFLIKVFAENFGRFLRIGTQTLHIDYNLGVENPWYYYPMSLAAGFLPWTLLLIVSLFFLKYKKISLKSLGTQIIRLNKTQLYTLISIVIPILFFSVPASKRSVYIMLCYPFIALYMAQYFIYLAKEKQLSVKIMAWFMSIISIIILAVFLLTKFRLLNQDKLAHSLASHNAKTLHDWHIFSELFMHPTAIGIIIAIVLVIAIILCFKNMKRDNGNKLLISTLALMIVINIYMDGFLLPAYKDSYSSKPFAEMISKKYRLENNTYVINDLLKFPNLYGLNFYLQNDFQNFEKVLPQQGYFLSGEKAIGQIEKEYDNRYTFKLLESSDRYNDFKQKMLLFWVEKKVSNPVQ